MSYRTGYRAKAAAAAFFIFLESCDIFYDAFSFVASRSKLSDGFFILRSYLHNTAACVSSEIRREPDEFHFVAPIKCIRDGIYEDLRFIPAHRNAYGEVPENYSRIMENSRCRKL